MRRAVLWPSAWVAVFAVCAPRHLNAQVESSPTRLSVTLDYDVPSECPDATQFKALVAKRLGREPFVDRAANRVFVSISQSDDSIFGKLVWRDGTGNSTGEQSFPSRNKQCGQLIAAMAFALVVQVQLLDATPKSDSGGASRTDATPPVVAVASTPPAGPDIAPASASLEHNPISSPARRPDHRRSQPMVAAGGGATIALGMSSEPVLGARIFAGPRWTFAAMEFAIEAGAPTVKRRADGAGFSQWYLLSSATGCAILEPLSACAVLKAGTVRVVGRDIDAPKGAGAALVQTGFRLGLSQRLSAGTLLSVRGEGLRNLTRWAVSLNQDAVWQAPALAFVSGLDFVVLVR